MKKLTMILIIAALLSSCASEERRAEKRALRRQELEARIRYEQQHDGEPPPEKPSLFTRVLGAAAAIKGAQPGKVNCTSNQLGNTVYTNCR